MFLVVMKFYWWGRASIFLSEQEPGGIFRTGYCVCDMKCKNPMYRDTVGTALILRSLSQFPSHCVGCQLLFFLRKKWEANGGERIHNILISDMMALILRDVPSWVQIKVYMLELILGFHVLIPKLRGLKIIVYFYFVKNKRFNV